MERYDLCLVFDVGDQDKDFSYEDGHPENTKNEFEHFEDVREKMFTSLEQAHLDFTIFKSQDKKNVFCLIAAKEKRLKKEAARIQLDMLLDRDEAFKHGKALNMKLADHVDDDDMCHIGIECWDHLYGPFCPNDDKFPTRENLYKTYKPNFFRTTERIKLINVILEAPQDIHGCQFNISYAIEDSKHPLTAFYPLHEQEKLEYLGKKMSRFDSLRVLPLNDIREYFGEQVGFYFGFLQFYAKVLLVPALFGTTIFILQLFLSKKLNAIFLPILGVIISLWSTIFLERWKHKESRLRGKWGMANFAFKEPPRPSFTGSPRPSSINGQEDRFFPTEKRIIRQFFSYSVIIVFVIVVIVTVIGVVFLRIWLVQGEHWSLERSSYIASFANAIAIHVMNFVYGQVAHKLNSWENHRTETDYENGIIAKSFLFKSVNSYYGLFYMAFMQKYDPTNRCPKHDPNCMQALRTNLGVIFVTQIFINNVVKVLTPWIKANIYSYRHKELKDATDAEKDFHLKEEYENTIEDFDNLTIHHGYATLFIIALPITPLFAFLGKIMENKLDSYMLLHEYRRPIARGASNIGLWSTVFEIIGYLNVITNIALMTVAGDAKLPLLGDSSWTVKIIVFVLVEHFLFLVKAAASSFIPDESPSEILRSQRQDYVVKRLLTNKKSSANSDVEDKAIKKNIEKKYNFDQLPNEFQPDPIQYDSENKTDETDEKMEELDS